MFIIDHSRNQWKVWKRKKGRRGDHSGSTRAWKYMDCVESNKNPLEDQLSWVMALSLSEERELVFVTQLRNIFLL